MTLIGRDDVSSCGLRLYVIPIVSFHASGGFFLFGRRRCSALEMAAGNGIVVSTNTCAIRLATDHYYRIFFMTTVSISFPLVNCGVLEIAYFAVYLADYLGVRLKLSGPNGCKHIQIP